MYCRVNININLFIDKKIHKNNDFFVKCFSILYNINTKMKLNTQVIVSVIYIYTVCINVCVRVCVCVCVLYIPLFNVPVI